MTPQWMEMSIFHLDLQLQAFLTVDIGLPLSFVKNDNFMPLR